EKPLIESAIDAVVEKMTGEVKDRMGNYGPRFPVVALMARGRRVLTLHRTSLSSQHVDALFCAQDWITKGINEKFIGSKLKNLSIVDEVVKEIKEAVRSVKGQTSGGKH
ncbi:hypothetical protein Tco_1083580, partial [Tanacetum coccineum]